MEHVRLKIAQEVQESINKTKGLDRMLTSYTELFGRVQEVSEIPSGAGPPNLLTMRFALMKSARDHEAKQAASLVEQLQAISNTPSSK